MFAFGIIVSPLPYAAVVVLYAFYLLFVQFNDSYDSQLADENQEEKQIILEEESQNSLTDVYFVDLSEDKDFSKDKNTVLESRSAFRSVSCLDLHLYEEWSAKPHLTDFSYSLYGRPPPSFI
jgi:hypothetical protein